MVERATVDFSYQIVSRKNKEGIRQALSPAAGSELYDPIELYNLKLDAKPGDVFIPRKVRLSPLNLYKWRTNAKIPGDKYSIAVIALLTNKTEMEEFVGLTEKTINTRRGGALTYNIMDVLSYLLFPKDKIINIKGKKYNIVSRRVQPLDNGKNISFFLEVTRRDTSSEPAILKRGRQRASNDLYARSKIYSKEKCGKKGDNLKKAFSKCTDPDTADECRLGII